MSDKQTEFKNNQKTLKPYPKNIKNKPPPQYHPNNAGTTKANRNQLIQTATVRRPISTLNDNKILQSHLKNIFKTKNSQHCVEHIIDIISHMLHIQQKKYPLIGNNQLYKLTQYQDENKQQFAVYINIIIDICYQGNLTKSLYAACNYFYKLYLKKNNFDQCEIYAITAIFTSSKYFEIYPPWLNEIIKLINQTITEHRVYEAEGKLIQYLNFMDFYSDSEDKWLQLLGIIIGLNQQQRLKCQFILDSGLTNIKLHKVRPSYRALAAISLYKKISKDIIELNVSKQIIRITQQQLIKIQRLLKLSIIFNKDVEIKSIQVRYYQQVGIFCQSLIK